MQERAQEHSLFAHHELAQVRRRSCGFQASVNHARIVRARPRGVLRDLLIRDAKMCTAYGVFSTVKQVRRRHTTISISELVHTLTLQKATARHGTVKHAPIPTHLEDESVAAHEGSNQGVEHVVQGVVPRHNRADHAEGHEFHVDL